MRRLVINLVLISDTHELHHESIVPPGNILIHAGDFIMFDRSRTAIDDFDSWLGELPHRHKLVVYGNHQFAFEAKPDSRSLLSNATVLLNEGVTIMD